MSIYILGTKGALLTGAGTLFCRASMTCVDIANVGSVEGDEDFKGVEVRQVGELHWSERYILLSQIGFTHMYISQLHTSELG